MHLAAGILCGGNNGIVSCVPSTALVAFVLRKKLPKKDCECVTDRCELDGLYPIPVLGNL